MADSLYLPYLHGTNMPKKSFFENELNNTWREAREKGIEVRYRTRPQGGHPGERQEGHALRRLRDAGHSCMDPSDIDVNVFNRWREYTMSDGNRKRERQ